MRRSLLIAALVWLLVSAVHVSGILDGFESRILDWRFRLRGERAPSESIALVCVDDATIHAYGAWPIPRDAFALLVVAVQEGHARALGVDLQFPDDPRQKPAWNQLLAQVSESGNGAVHSIWFQSERSAGRPPPATEIADALRRRGTPARDVRVARASTVSLPFDALVTSTVPLGHISVALDPDGAIRRLPLLIRYDDRIYPALSLQLIGTLAGGGEIESIRRTAGGVDVGWASGSVTFVPTDAEGAAPLDFAGDRKAFPYRYSMLDVLQWYRDGNTAALRDAFEGRVVLIGLTAREEAAEDIGATPFSATTPLVLVHANAIENLLSGRFLTRVPVPMHLAVLAFLAMLMALVVRRLSIPVAAAAVVALTALFVAIDVFLLAGPAIDLPALPGLMLPALVYAAVGSDRHLFLQRWTREREREIREGRTIQQRFLPEALVGSKLSRYVIEEKLGSGGMGAVYRARDTSGDRHVAIKVLHGGALADEETRRRFRREARAHARFRHPGAAAFYEFDSQDGVDFLVMEYIEGVSLADRLKQGALQESEAVRIALEVTEVLEAAHQRGVIHRDIKPANVILTPEGHARLLDFGIAHLAAVSATSSTLTRRLTGSGEIIGTPAYVSPEVIEGDAVGPYTDVYGVGLLLFEMTTGRRPFPDDHAAELMHLVLNQPPPRPRILNARVSVALEQIILRALAKRPEDRFGRAAELSSALRQARP